MGEVESTECSEPKTHAGLAGSYSCHANLSDANLLQFKQVGEGLEQVQVQVPLWGSGKIADFHR